MDLTPNLDAFAAEAMRFDRAHVNAAICAPCRAIIAAARLIAEPDHSEAIAALQARLVAHMQQTGDPMLAAFQHRADRAAVDQVLRATYGPWHESAKKNNARQGKRGATAQ